MNIANDYLPEDHCKGCQYGHVYMEYYLLCKQIININLSKKKVYQNKVYT